MPRKSEIACWVCGHNAEPGTGHLEILKRMRIRISEAVFDEDTAPRDLASLSRRLQDLTQEIDTLEERLRLEGKSTNVSANNNSAKATAKWDPSEV